MKQLVTTLVLILQLHANSAMATPLPPELIGRHSGAMGQQGESAKDGALCFYEHRVGLGGVEIKGNGELVVPFAIGSEDFTRLAFKFHNYKLGATDIWHPLKVGGNRYSAALFRYGAVFRILVKQHRKDGSVAAIQWICAEPRKAEQGGADQPATAPESELEGKEKPKPKSEGRNPAPQSEKGSVSQTQDWDLAREQITLSAGEILTSPTLEERGARGSEGVTVGGTISVPHGGWNYSWKVMAPEDGQVILERLEATRRQ